MNHVDPDGRVTYPLDNGGYAGESLSAPSPWIMSFSAYGHWNDGVFYASYWNWWSLGDPSTGSSTGGGGGRTGPNIVGTSYPNWILALFNVDTSVDEQSRRGLLNTVLQGLSKRISNSGCNSFLNSAISTLRGAGILNSTITQASDIINIALNSSTVHLYGAVDLDSGRLGKGTSATWAASGDSDIYLGEHFFNTSTYANTRGDQVSTIIHELYQVGTASANGRFISDFTLDKLIGDGSYGSWGDLVRTNCGPH